MKMTEFTPIAAGSRMDTAPHPLRLTISEFFMLDQAGAFAEFSKAELIEGEVFLVNAQHRPHSFIKNEISYRLRDRLREIGSHLCALVEATVELPPKSLPEPDIILTSEPIGAGFIPVSSLALVVEVADTSFDQDMGRKAEMYQAHLVPEYWVVDVRGHTIHQMTLAGDGRYKSSDPLPFGATIKSTTVPNLEIDTHFPV